MKKKNLQQAATKEDIDEAVAQIAVVIDKALQDYATKDDVKKLAKADDLKKVEDKVDGVAADVSDIRRRVIDLETDTVTRTEFNDFKSKLLPA